MGLKTFPQLKAAGLMPLSREQLRRAIKAGHYRAGVRFGGPRSREHWDENYARERAGLDQATNASVNDDDTNDAA
jgi:hypothetical protein